MIEQYERLVRPVYDISVISVILANNVDENLS